MLRRVVVLVVSFAAALLTCVPAHADRTCKQYDKRSGICHVDSHDGPGGGSTKKGPKSLPLACIDSTFVSPDGTIACTGPLGEWSNAYQCYLKLYAGESTDIHKTRRFHCYAPAYAGGVDRFVVTTIYTGPLVDPEAVARGVVASLQLHAIHIGLAPHAGSTGLVQLPVWMWAADPDGRTWGPASASKTEQGLTVVVTASVKTVDWDMGDGTIVTCGVGTARPTGGGTNASPDCGHTYTTTSAGKPGGAFTVTATSHWTINWASGAQQGTFPFELSDTAPLTIIESRAVLTAP